MIAENPEVAAERTEVSPPMRLHVHGRHVIAYRLEGWHVDVVRILHARRNWRLLLGGA